MAEKFILDPRFPGLMRKILSAAGPWRWCLIGGRAVEVWTNPPQTPDVDILCTVPDEDVPRLADAFSRHSLHPLAPVLAGDPHAKFYDRSARVEVDLLVAFDALHFEIVSRAVWKSIRTVRMPVATAEDIVMLKAQAATDPGREKGKRIRDRRAILDLSKSARFDRAMIRERLAFHRWTDELALLRFLRVV